MTNRFSMISERIGEYRLKPRDHAVYCCLVKHSDKNGVCFPSRRLIAEECCIDKKLWTQRSEASKKPDP